MAKKIEWTTEQIEDIIKRYKKSQETTREIAEIYNCSKRTIGTLLKENNVELISRRTINKKPPRQPRKNEDKVGKVYGKLTVIKEGPRYQFQEIKSGRQRYWC